MGAVPQRTPSGQGSPGREMRPVDLHSASMSLQRNRRDLTPKSTRSFAEGSARTWRLREARAKGGMLD
jgi:hypothetical protein